MPLTFTVIGRGCVVESRTMCAAFWISVVILFFGILFVTGKHWAGWLQVMGGIFIGVSSCGIICCGVLVIHESRAIAGVHAPDKLPPVDTSNHSMQGKNYELPPLYSNPANGTKRDIVDEHNVQISGSTYPGDAAHRAGGNADAWCADRHTQDRVKLLDSGGGYAFYRTVPSTIDEEDEISTHSPTPSGRLAMPPSLATNDSAATAAMGGASMKYSLSTTSSSTRAAPFRLPYSFPLVTPPPLPTPPRMVSPPPRSITPPKQFPQIAVKRITPPIGVNFSSPSTSRVSSVDRIESDFRTSSELESNNSPKSQAQSPVQSRESVTPSSHYPSVVIQEGRATPTSGDEKHRVTARVTPLLNSSWDRATPYVSNDSDFPNTSRNPYSNYEHTQRTQKSYECDAKNQNQSRVLPSGTELGRTYAASREFHAAADESDFSPAVTLDRTASEESYPVSTASDETIPHTVTSPESVVMSSEYASHATRNATALARPSARLVHNVPNLRAHSAALSGAHQPAAGGMPIGGMPIEGIPVGLMMRPFVDGNVTVTPLAGDGTYLSHTSQRPVAGVRLVEERLTVKQSIPLQSYPSDRDDLASNITEASIDSKVTLYDNVHYVKI